MKNKFDPDKFIADNEKEFDPDKFIADMEPEQEIVSEDKVSNIGSFSEENPLIKGAYSVGDKLSYLDKARSAVMGPLIQAATLGSPIETIKKEYTNLEPQPESSFVGRAREIFPNQNPIMDTPIEDIEQGERLKAASKAWLQNKFPKAYGVASSMVPSDVAAMPIDMVLSQKMPSIPVGKVTSLISSKLDDMAVLNREKTLVNEVGQTGSKAAKEIDSLKTQKVTNTLERYGVSGKLKNPYELKKSLSGETRLSYDSNGNQVPTKVSKGIIGQLGDELRMGADHLTNKIGNVDIKNIADKAIEKLEGAYRSESSAVPFGPKESETLKKQIYSILKVKEGDNYRPFDSLIDSKRNSAKYYFDLKNDPATPMVAGPSLTASHKAIWDQIDNHIDDVALTDPDVSAFARQNSDMSDLLNAEEMLGGARQQSIMSPNLIDIGAGAGIGYGLGTAVGSPQYGAFIGGGIGAMRGAATEVRTTIPARIGSAQQSLANKISPITQVQTGNPMANMTATIRSIPTQQEQYMMRRGLVENLADFQVPRSASAILSNKDMVFAKVAQATNDPAILEGLKESLSKHPDKLKSILPVLVMQFPQLFEADKYNRVDGRIFHPDPMMQEKLRNDAKNEVESRRDKMTNTERIMILRGLNMDGSLPESIQ